jgi:DNA-binding response OmpR family regulator
MRPKKTILCFDADEMTLSVRKYLLETRGYRIFAVTSEADAIELFRARPFDLVIVELSRPAGDGRKLVEQLKEIDSAAVVMMTSAWVLAGHITHSADAFLGRDYTPAEFIERIRIMVARKRGPRKKEPVSVGSVGEMRRLA